MKCSACGKVHDMTVELQGAVYCLPCFRKGCAKVGSVVRRGIQKVAGLKPEQEPKR